MHLVQWLFLINQGRDWKLRRWYFVETLTVKATTRTNEMGTREGAILRLVYWIERDDFREEANEVRKAAFGSR